ncbi:hypothetical protein C8R45DRAFT_264759 [Mycena sanguinolenta]|nr:hypothetical protein C8R45DRAFT_264759 [Mycena sanguinolenta]
MNNLAAALLWCILVFSLLVGHMAVGDKPNVISVFVAIWTIVTFAVLIVLLCVGSSRYSGYKLGRTVTQIHVLCALGVSWLLLMAGIITMNANPNSMCGRYYRGDCRKLFYAAHAFSWILTITLFSAAYATYRRAVAIHGATMTIPPPPPMVPAWRLSSVADNEESMREGTVKI